MNPKYVILYLIGKGYKELPISTEYVGHLYKSIPSLPFCKSNDKSPGIEVKIYKRNVEYESVEFKLTAEDKDGLWNGFVIYGLSYLDVEQKIDLIEEKLCKTWIAVNS